MAPLEINVTGSAIAKRPAELATLRLSLTTKPFATAQEADSAIAIILNSLINTIAPYCEEPSDTSGGGAGSTNKEGTSQSPSTMKSQPQIERYTISTNDTTTARMHRSEDNSGMFSSMSKTSYASGFKSSADLSIAFRSFTLLARLATQISSTEHVGIKNLTWHLSPETKASVESEARKGAARDALNKARDYAQVFAGLSEHEALGRVKATEVKEKPPYDEWTSAKFHGKRAEGEEKGRVVQKAEWDYEGLDMCIQATVDGKFVVE